MPKHIINIKGRIVFDPADDLLEIDGNRPIYMLADKPVEVTITKRADGRLEIYIHNA